ncbi:integration host factor subunit beta [Thiospirochaeta perfilievii]|uniref:Integration host factor subunit beta n=1 Tax=Thiospirochaeta perfilievii TaxID=252967 RepID=A0A5C1Q6H9_9SPIO|nr:HU family DNA-binding protein [Thiospirochaeta perfilievii]QEN03595.1 integration host factor subunit beta [Thiospirochaeta perfilievii]
MKLTKAEIVNNIYESVDVNKKDIHAIIDNFFDEVKNALVDSKVVELRGFGTFEVKTRKAREKARNPKTGEIIPVDSHGVTVFRPGKELKELTWNVKK